MYEIIFDKFSIRFLKKLDKNLSKRIYNKIIKSKKDPFRDFIKLTNSKNYKLRVGNYRVIAEIKKKNATIYILKIGHRHNIYHTKN